ncbi:hypothetical protein BJ508DRAFT_330333 [Ascobolus immersus RN42]|uniref:Uncharacterized protein n=1 Tax=Ascobolus immersus RN42 TaxID=1160509 RepID=A0A3N4I5U7_ASCIM|nr:hypothetical protein BJ508DRAFT_330333 [Ascobolus immersus RN42]
MGCNPGKLPSQLQPPESFDCDRLVQLTSRLSPPHHRPRATIIDTFHPFGHICRLTEFTTTPIISSSALIVPDSTAPGIFASNNSTSLACSCPIHSANRKSKLRRLSNRAALEQTTGTSTSCRIRWQVAMEMHRDGQESKKLCLEPGVHRLSGIGHGFAPAPDVHRYDAGVGPTHSVKEDSYDLTSVEIKVKVPEPAETVGIGVMDMRNGRPGVDQVCMMPCRSFDTSDPDGGAGGGTGTAAGCYYTLDEHSGQCSAYVVCRDEENANSFVRESHKVTSSTGSMYTVYKARQIYTVEFKKQEHTSRQYTLKKTSTFDFDNYAYGHSRENFAGFLVPTIDLDFSSVRGLLVSHSVVALVWWKFAEYVEVDGYYGRQWVVRGHGKFLTIDCPMGRVPAVDFDSHVYDKNDVNNGATGSTAITVE